VAGAVIKGVVHVSQQQPFMATQLVLDLVGYEEYEYII
jgi:hypothetical protein